MKRQSHIENRIRFGFHAHRITGGDCGHHDPGGLAFAGAFKGEDNSARDRVREQSQAIAIGMAPVHPGQ